jgi:hypothetical protein
MRLKMKKLKLQLAGRPCETAFHYDSRSYALNFDEGSYYPPNAFSTGISAASGSCAGYLLYNFIFFRP